MFLTIGFEDMPTMRRRCPEDVPRMRRRRPDRTQT
jgi:hypothetical protein